jgi:hypothetical protein
VYNRVRAETKTGRNGPDFDFGNVAHRQQGACARAASVVPQAAPALWFQQDAFDHVGVDIVRFQVLQGRHRIGAELDRQALVNNIASQ